jgi:hypothetical protein
VSKVKAICDSYVIFWPVWYNATIRWACTNTQGAGKVGFRFTTLQVESKKQVEYRTRLPWNYETS